MSTEVFVGLQTFEFIILPVAIRVTVGTLCCSFQMKQYEIKSNCMLKAAFQDIDKMLKKKENHIKLHIECRFLMHLINQ